MRKLKLTQARRNRFLEALSESGSVTNAVTVAGTSRTRVYELRKTDVDFAFAWDEAEERAADGLHEEARRRAIEGVPELLVSAGKLVRDDDGQPIVVKRYPNSLLLALLKAHRPSRAKNFTCRLCSRQVMPRVRCRAFLRQFRTERLQRKKRSSCRELSRHI